MFHKPLESRGACLPSLRGGLKKLLSFLLSLLLANQFSLVSQRFLQKGLLQQELSSFFVSTRRQLRGPLRIHRNGPLLILFSLKSPMTNNAFHIFQAITGFYPAFRHGKPYRPFSKKCRETAPRLFPSPPFSIGRVSGRFPP